MGLAMDFPETFITWEDKNIVPNWSLQLIEYALLGNVTISTITTMLDCSQILSTLVICLK